MDSNRGYLLSGATTLPTEPQPLPQKFPNLALREVHTHTLQGVVLGSNPFQTFFGLSFRTFRSELIIVFGRFPVKLIVEASKVFSFHRKRPRRDNQCDQVARLYVQYLPILNKLIYPIAWKICQSMLKILPNNKLHKTKLSKTLKICSKWRKFAKSGHTGDN